MRREIGHLLRKAAFLGHAGDHQRPLSPGNPAGELFRRWNISQFRRRRRFPGRFQDPRRDRVRVRVPEAESEEVEPEDVPEFTRTTPGHLVC